MSVDRILQAEILSNQQARKRQNGKVQVFEGGKPSTDRGGLLQRELESSQTVILLSSS